jgi:putative molybdopterin biosynthesis protein
LEKKEFLSTREVASLININEKLVYGLINEKGLPATKVTGKWLFPLHLVEQWLENETINHPRDVMPLPPYHGLLIICGSNDIMLDKTISFYNNTQTDHVAVFGNMGSMGGIRALQKNLCHVATSHLMQEDETEYNFGFAIDELGQMPAIVNFCKREQGLIVQKGNPKNIRAFSDLGNPEIRIVNRPKGTGTRLLFDGELKKAGLNTIKIDGYDIEVQSHMDVGLEVIAGRADAGLGVKAVAGLLGLEFIPLRWERFDFIILKDRFFEQGVQLFLGTLRNQELKKSLENLDGYDLTHSGEMIFPSD